MPRPSFAGLLTDSLTTGSLMGFKYLNKMKNSEARTLRESEMRFYHLVQVGLRAGCGGSWLGAPTMLERGICWSTHLPAEETSHSLCKGPSQAEPGPVLFPGVSPLMLLPLPHPPPTWR